MSGSAPHRLVLAFHSEVSEDLSLACKAGGWSCCQGGAGRMPVFFFFFQQTPDVSDHINEHFT